MSLQQEHGAAHNRANPLVPSLLIPSRPGVQASASADATMERRWKALTVTAPLHQLVRNIAHHDIDEQAYDLRQLALSALDAVVASMGYGQELSVQAAADHLVSLARRMKPNPARAEEHQQVAAAVLQNLLNHTGEQRRFTYRYADMDTDPVTWRSHSFKLLQLRETESGDCLIASDQAVMLYVSALDTDLEDAEYAHAVMLRRQLDDGRLEAAEASAAFASRTSEGFSATLSKLLADTVRDVGSHDWQVDVPARLTRARKHISERIGDDAKLLEHLQGGLGPDVTAEVRATSGRIIDLLDVGQRMHLQVLNTLVDARDTHVRSLTRQRLSARPRLRTIQLGRDLLRPALGASPALAETVTTAFADAALGVSVPRQATLNLALRSLWAPVRTVERVPPPAEEKPAGEAELDPQAYPPEIVRSGPALSGSRRSSRRSTAPNWTRTTAKPRPSSSRSARCGRSTRSSTPTTTSTSSTCSPQTCSPSTTERCCGTRGRSAATCSSADAPPTPTAPPRPARP